MNELNLEKIFNYPEDRTVIRIMVRSLNHISLVKAFLKYLHKNNDEELPKLIIEFCNRRFSKGYRASVIRLLEKYDCQDIFFDILKLFLKDSYNVTWFAYDILVKYISRIENVELLGASSIILSHIKNERSSDKKEYHKLLLKKLTSEIKKRKIIS